MAEIIPFIDAATVPYVGTFLLVFAVVYGLLSFAGSGKSKFLGFDKRVNAIIAVVFAFFAVMYQPLVLGLQEFMPFAIVGLIVIFFAMFIKKLFGGSGSHDTFPQVVSLGILLILLGVFRNDLVQFLPSGFDVNNMLWII